MNTCQGKRRMMRGHVWGLFPCRRKARYVFETYVGLSRSHYTCGEDECVRSITSGYPANNFRELAK